MEARGARGIAEALDAANAKAIRKNEDLIKDSPSAMWFLARHS